MYVPDPITRVVGGRMGPWREDEADVDKPLITRPQPLGVNPDNAIQQGFVLGLLKWLSYTGALLVAVGTPALVLTFMRVDYKVCVRLPTTTTVHYLIRAYPFHKKFLSTGLFPNKAYPLLRKFIRGG